MVKESLEERMKTYYEAIPKNKLMRRTPVIIRLDGKAFHTFTRGFDKPFDAILMKTMQDTMKDLCANIQGCVLGYTQSDEITLVLVDYQKIDSGAWFDYEIQKMTSVSAAMATLYFNKWFAYNCAEYTETDEDFKRYARKINTALFDSRVFNIPKEEVANCIFWRQLDAERNSILMVGQSQFSPKELHKKTCKDIVTMLEEQKGIVWGNLPTDRKRGSCCIKKLFFKDPDGNELSEDLIYQMLPEGGWAWRSDDKEVQYPIDDFHAKWVVDHDIPRFVGEGREYIRRLVYVGD